MDFIRRLALAAAASACVAGCANLGSIAPGMSAQDIQSRAGSPQNVWKNTDGTETWEYRTGPAGFHTYMVTLGANRSVREVHDALQEAYFSKVTPGMSRDEVRRLLGGPKEIHQFPALQEEVWSWRYRESNVFYYFFNVHFDQGSAGVRRVSRIEDPYYTDRGGRER